MPRKPASSQSLHEVVRKKMPGWSVVRIGPGVNVDAKMDAAIPPAVDAVMPSLDKLKKKFLGSTSPTAVSPDAAAVPTDSNTQTVTIESQGMKKVIGVTDDGEVIWRQG